MVVPLSPGELQRKIDAIYKHQSQVGSRGGAPGGGYWHFSLAAAEGIGGVQGLFQRLA